MRSCCLRVASIAALAWLVGVAIPASANPPSADGAAAQPAPAQAGTGADPASPPPGSNGPPPNQVFDWQHRGLLRDATSVNTLTLDIRPQMGFAYLRPSWSNDFFRGFGNPEDLNYGFEFVPKLEFVLKKYDPERPYSQREEDEEKEFKASGQRLRLSGDLNRTITTGAGSTNQQTKADITIDVVDLAVLPLKLNQKNTTWLGKQGFLPSALDLELGIRYAALKQQYFSLARAGDSVSQLESNQSAGGFGVSAALSASRIDRVTLRDFTLSAIATARGSVLFGISQKDSTFRGPGNLAASITDRENEVIPVGELELGLDLSRVEQKADAVIKVTGIRASLVGQVWGDVAMISAALPEAQRFRDGNFYLYGGMVTFHLKF